MLERIFFFRCLNSMLRGSGFHEGAYGNSEDSSGPFLATNQNSPRVMSVYNRVVVGNKYHINILENASWCLQIRTSVFLWRYINFKFQKKTQLSSLSMLRFMSLLLLSILLLADGSAAASSCFTQQGDRYSKPSNRTETVSAGLVCPKTQSNSTCTISSGGYVTERSTLNITTANSNADIFRTVTNQSFDTSLVGNVDGYSFTMNPGQNGYIGFTLTYDCYQGVLGGGCFKDVDAGTAVEACRPVPFGSGGKFPTLKGTFSWVTTDAASANFTTNPAAAKPQDSLACRAERSGGLLALTAMGLVVALLSM